MKEEEEIWGDIQIFIPKGLPSVITEITRINSLGVAKDQNPQKPAKVLSCFIAPPPPHRKIISERGKTEQKSSDLWTKFQKQIRWIAVAKSNVSNIAGGNSDIKGVSERFSSPLFSDLLHHRQIFVRSPENGGSESKNVPKL